MGGRGGAGGGEEASDTIQHTQNHPRTHAPTKQNHSYLYEKPNPETIENKIKRKKGKKGKSNQQC